MPGTGPADTGLVDDAVLLTSELVTNAVVHAGTQVQVTCKLAASAVEVVVRDSHPARMVPGPEQTTPFRRNAPAAAGSCCRPRWPRPGGSATGPTAKAVWFRMGLAGQKASLTEPVADPDAAEPAVPGGGLERAGGQPGRGWPAACRALV